MIKKCDINLLALALSLLFFALGPRSCWAQTIIDSFEAPGILSGYTPISTLDDINANGWREIVYGVPDTGTVIVRSVKIGSDIWSYTDSHTNAGKSLATIHDVNGDGFRDILVGLSKGSNPSRIMSSFNGNILETLMPSCGSGFPSCYRGLAVATLGDQNDDGTPEMVISVPGYQSPSTGTTTGRVYVLNGKSFDYDNVISGPAYSSIGWRVTRIGDLNRDGYEDLLIASLNNGGGGVQAYSPRMGQVIYRVPPSQISGIMVLFPTKDIDGDGTVDFLANSSVDGSAVMTIYSGIDGEPLLDLQHKVIPIPDTQATNIQKFASVSFNDNQVTVSFANSDTFVISKQMAIPVAGVSSVTLYPMEDINGDGIGEVTVMVGRSDGANMVYIVSPLTITNQPDPPIPPQPPGPNAPPDEVTIPAGPTNPENPSLPQTPSMNGYMPAMPFFTRPNSRTVTAHFEEIPGSTYLVNFQSVLTLKGAGKVVSRTRKRVKRTSRQQPFFTARLFNRAPFTSRLRVRYAAIVGGQQSDFTKWRTVTAKR